MQEIDDPVRIVNATFSNLHYHSDLFKISTAFIRHVGYDITSGNYYHIIDAREEDQIVGIVLCDVNDHTNIFEAIVNAASKIDNQIKLITDCGMVIVIHLPIQK